MRSNVVKCRHFGLNMVISGQFWSILGHTAHFARGGKPTQRSGPRKPKGLEWVGWAGRAYLGIPRAHPPVYPSTITPGTHPNTPCHRTAVPFLIGVLARWACTYGRFRTPVGEPRGMRTHVEPAGTARCPKEPGNGRQKQCNVAVSGSVLPDLPTVLATFRTCFAEFRTCFTEFSSS